MAALVDPRLVAQVAAFEGFRAESYLCSAGKLTYGYGFTTRPDGTPVQAGDTVTETDSRARLQRTLARLRAQVDKLITAEVEPHVLDACVSLTFNIGLEGFRTSTCLRKLNEGDLPGAATALKAWNKVTKNNKKVVDKGLVARRAVESRLLLDGWDALDPSRPAPVRAPLMQSRTMLGGSAAAVASAIALGEQVRELVAASQPLLQLEPVVLGIVAAISLIGAGVTLFARWDDARTGVA
jgi:GH24 family phage-related lysozyme (muramidase)